VREARVDGNSPDGFRRYFAGLGESTKVVQEACWNWGKLYDLLEQIEHVAEVTLAHPTRRV